MTSWHLINRTFDFTVWFSPFWIDLKGFGVKKIRKHQMRKDLLIRPRRIVYFSSKEK